MFLIGELNALDVIAFGVGNAGGWAFASVSASLISTIVALVLAVLADITVKDEDLTNEENNGKRDSSSMTNATPSSEQHGNP